MGSEPVPFQVVGDPRIRPGVGSFLVLGVIPGLASFHRPFGFEWLSQVPSIAQVAIRMQTMVICLLLGRRAAFNMARVAILLLTRVVKLSVPLLVHLA